MVMGYKPEWLEWHPSLGNRMWDLISLSENTDKFCGKEASNEDVQKDMCPGGVWASEWGGWSCESMLRGWRQAIMVLGCRRQMNSVWLAGLLLILKTPWTSMTVVMTVNCQPKLSFTLVQSHRGKWAVGYPACSHMTISLSLKPAGRSRCHTNA